MVNVGLALYTTLTRITPFFFGGTLWKMDGRRIRDLVVTKRLYDE